MIRSERVVVVGAGILGVWTSLHLLAGGQDVVMIDQLGPGNLLSSSGGETRILRTLYGDDQLYLALMADAVEQWEAAQARWGRKVFVKSGTVWLFASEDSYARGALPLLPEFGFSAIELSLREAAMRWPQVNLEGINSVFHEPDSGYLMARASTQAACNEFVIRGGQYLRGKALPLDKEDVVHLDEVQLEDGSTIRGEAFVFACGAWLGKIMPSVLGEYISPTRQDVYFFETPEHSTAYSDIRLPVWAVLDERLRYGIPGPPGSPFKICDDTHGDPFDPDTSDRDIDPIGIDGMREFLGSRFPGLAEAPLSQIRVCQYENSPDGQLIVDRHPFIENVWVVGGGSGHAFKLAPAIGRMAAGQVSAGTAPEPLFRISRLKDLGEKVTQHGLGMSHRRF